MPPLPGLTLSYRFNSKSPFFHPCILINARHLRIGVISLDQDEAAMWNNYVALVQLVPATLSNLLLSSYCDRVGHRVPMLLPLLSAAMSTAWLAVMTTPGLQHWPLETALAYGVLGSCLGSFPMASTLSSQLV